MDSPPLLLSGKICLITGGTAGIGAASARMLTRLGAKVYIVGRNEERCQAVVARIANDNLDYRNAPCADYLVGDMADMTTVSRVSDEFCQRSGHLDILVNNVGAIFNSRQVTPDGFEMTWALNHLGYFLLTHRLLGLIKDTAARQGETRIINVSSAAHRGSKIRFDDLQGERFFNPWRAYGQSKLANILFTFELDRRLRGSRVTANALHPGFVASRFSQNNPGWWRLILSGLHRFAITPEEGAATTVYLASSPKVSGVSGMYFVNARPTSADTNAYDSHTARKLWQVSQEMLADFMG